LASADTVKTAVDFRSQLLHREYLPKDARVIHFVNADLIPGGLSPLHPDPAGPLANGWAVYDNSGIAPEKED
jgi:predicted ABC-type ATPase